MKIALGSDHRGADLLRAIDQHLRAQGHETITSGICATDSCDYPDQAWSVGQAIQQGRAEVGIVACGSGIGIMMAANKMKGIRAALVGDVESAALTRRHNDANVLCLSGDRVDAPLGKRIADAFISTAFEGGRHARRVAKLAMIESDRAPDAGAAPG